MKRALSLFLLMLMVLPAGVAWLSTMYQHIAEDDFVHQVGVQFGLTPTYHEQIRMLYSSLGVPQKTDREIQKLLRKYRGKEPKLLKKIRRKYVKDEKQRRKQQQQQVHWEQRKSRRRSAAAASGGGRKTRKRGGKAKKRKGARG